LLPLELLILLTVANGTPVVAKRLLGELILSRLLFRWRAIGLIERKAAHLAACK
jgi:hypothetical protein